MADTTLSETDGRRRRREAGRLIAIDAAIDLTLEGHGPPTAEAVAERSGVSTASLFRYFENLDDLRYQSIVRFFERYDHLLEIPNIGEHALDRRIRTLCDSRISYYETVHPVSRLARARAVDIPELSHAVDRLRATLRDQIEQHFDRELAALRPKDRRERLAIIATTTSYETWDSLTREGLGRTAIRKAWFDTVDYLLRPRVT